MPISDLCYCHIIYILLYDNLKKFLISPAHVYDDYDDPKWVVKGSSPAPPKKPSKSSFSVTAGSSKGCCVCHKGEHPLVECAEFLANVLYQRFLTAKRAHVCLVYFSEKHGSSECQQSSCKECSLKYHTLLPFSAKSPTDVEKF